jgi:hypothetical protein
MVPLWLVYATNIATAMMATYAADIKKAGSYVNTNLTKLSVFRPGPRVGFTLVTKNQDTVEKLANAGFTKHSVNEGKTLYTGILTRANVT